MSKHNGDCLSPIEREMDTIIETIKGERSSLICIGILREYICKLIDDRIAMYETYLSHKNHLHPNVRISARIAELKSFKKIL